MGLGGGDFWGGGEDEEGCGIRQGRAGGSGREVAEKSPGPRSPFPPDPPRTSQRVAPRLPAGRGDP